MQSNNTYNCSFTEEVHFFGQDKAIDFDNLDAKQFRFDVADDALPLFGYNGSDQVEIPSVEDHFKDEVYYSKPHQSELENLEELQLGLDHTNEVCYVCKSFD
jgi:hypothetical protein